MWNLNNQSVLGKESEDFLWYHHCLEELEGEVVVVLIELVFVPIVEAAVVT